MDRNDWNAKYSAQDLVWGTEPNRFLAAELENAVAGGRALDLGCGEGRNAIWLAAQGWTVRAIDYSAVGLARARKLAAEAGVTVDWIEGDVVVYEPEEAAFALVIIMYLHLPREQRRQVLGHAASALARGGELFMVGHALRNLADGVGGPKSPAVLWDPEEIAAELTALALSVLRAGHVRRSVEGSEDTRDAIDTLVRAGRSR